MPHSVTAGIVFLSRYNPNISKKDVKNISEISEVTINKCFKKLEKMEASYFHMSNINIRKYNINKI